MRIISGKYKGKRLIAPKKLPVRPTTDFAKEGLFNILNNQFYFDELTVLDLFAGTGNISFEFASRGVPKITSVDAHSGCVQYINKIKSELEFPIQPIKSDVFTYLEKSIQKADIIFADPPYDIPLTEFNKIPMLVKKNGLLEEDGILIIEHAKQTDLSEIDGFTEKRKYGSSVFSFFEF
ncbi:RsmD family RNA methyltransferase [Galbibacter pacificus]|uniref:RsmD family RNA methyltransferase n=1 Tax=Galbibacter pacificus TaxID=2996052 RepID=A0ABT6FUE0_9FLAO|nr:RsmD family RNA methyltransferase [Galbibacter pacificus]MDG3583652.1 RsmD family RNA methyltransferase [Galbibacter pacificus]MDG3586872.1 RsmD family RNA methyltransferase [Galbibacter pacificus]